MPEFIHNPPSIPDLPAWAWFLIMFAVGMFYGYYTIKRYWR